MDRAGIHDSRIQTYGTAAQKQVAISLAQKETQESALDTGRQTIVQALNTNYCEQRRSEPRQAGFG